MNLAPWLPSLAVMVALGSVHISAQAPSSKPTAEQLALFDKNGDGRLDEAELDNLRKTQDVIELSPFIVVEDNNGYLASTAMSGTRINSRIEDLGASISVVTKQQLLDTAAVDINDVFQTEIGTEGTGQYTDQTIDGQGRVIDNVQASPYTANRIRGLASANITIDGFTSTTRIPFDAYNLDSVEISRGPNSSLSGLGDSGGTVNLNQSRANLGRESTQVTLRGDDWGGFRTSLDVNRPVLANKLALRVSTLYDSNGFRRKPSEDVQKRVYAAFTYKPFSRTSISGSYESFRQFRRTPNASTPTDMVSDWLAAGRPTWDPITSTVRINGVSVGTFVNQGTENTLLPRGLGRDSFFDNMPSVFIDNGEVVYFTNNRLQANGAPTTANFTGGIRLMTTYSDVARFRNATSGQAFPLDNLVGISNKEVYDYGSINAVATNWNRDTASLYKLQLEQKLFSSPMHQAYAQVAWRMEDSESFNKNILNETTNIYIDVNERLLDGTPNPFFLRPYVNTIQRTFNNTPIINDTGRAQLNYTLDLRQADNRWLSKLGRHQILGYTEVARKTSDTYQYREVVTDNVPWINQANRYNSSHATITDRYYIGDAVRVGSSGVVDYAPPKNDNLVGGTHDFRYASNVTGSNVTWTNIPLTIDDEAFGGANRRKEVNNTRGAILQSSFWKDQIVTTVGWREDKQRYRTTLGGFPIDSATGFGTSNLNSYGTWTYRSGVTTTYQGVIRPFKELRSARDWRASGGARGLLGELLGGFQLHYSYADSFRPTSPSVSLFGEPFDSPHGVGRDWGFSVRTSDNKFVARISWYKTTQYDAPISNNFPVIVLRNSFELGNNGLENFARGVISGRPAFSNATEDQIKSEIAKFTGTPEGYYDSIRAPANVTDINDQMSKGMEIELNYNPSRSLSFRFTAAQTKAIDLTLIDATQRFIDERLPIWTTIKNDAGQRWWDQVTTGPGSPAALYNVQIIPNLLRMRANLGKPRTQNKEWTWSGIASYRFTSGKLEGLSIGSSIRWADKSSIGYEGIFGSDGVVRELDYNKPVYDPARASYDFFARYNLRFFGDKVRARLQLNVRDAFANRGLRATSWNPEGYPATFRILDGRQWILTTTLDF
ncbi:MAG TPA: TonB-dependent receptor plug domain-containing protein [Opitutaceae bacterium]|nr:TonB-dependent receptor plug domain-containing protein [Opitutaceae bacterium]